MYLASNAGLQWFPSLFRPHSNHLTVSLKVRQFERSIKGESRGKKKKMKYYAIEYVYVGRKLRM